jgi:hypothetical protein
MSRPRKGGGDSGRYVVEVCKERNISEVTFHRKKNKFGEIDPHQA